MSFREASVVVALVITVAVPARAQGPGQGPGQPPPNNQGLAAQIADLQARVAKLEGNIVASDLAGTYSVTLLSTTMTALRPGTPVVNATINTAAGRGTITLNANGTGTLSGLTCEGSTLIQGSWAMHGFDCSEPSDSVTWTYANGVITITFLSDGDEIPFTVALGGRLFMMAFAPFHPSDPSSDQFMLIATRLR
jgi:hypothetical protein